MPKTFKWTVEIEVDESWVADGFDLTDERATDMALRELPYAYSHEVKARVIKAPALAKIMRTQGYSKEDIKATELAHA